MTAWVRADNLRCRFGTERQIDALRGVSLTVERGEFVSIVGPSGSGKSTLLYSLGGMRVPTSGRRVVCGVTDPDPATFARLRRYDIGFVFQAFQLLPRRSALENVMMGGRYTGEKYSILRRRALDALDSVGLPERASHRPGELSGGEQQRVAIARALVKGPSLVLADEPTGNLDSATGANVLETIHGANDAGATVILVTHDPDAASRADRMIQLLDGSVVGT